MNNNEPIILGKIKKSGASKPILIIIIFLIIGSIILFIPTISNYFGDYNIIDLIKNGEIIDFFKNHDSYINKINDNNNKDVDINKINYINSKTVIKSNGFVLNNFNLTNDNITFNIVRENIDLDKLQYYLVLKQNDKEIGVVRITNDSSINYSFKNKLNSLVDVVGNIKLYSDNDYPKYNLSSDESGLASLFCDKDNYSYEYIFDNSKLIQIKENYTYKDNGNNNLYLEEFDNYTKKVNLIVSNNGTSVIEENSGGFVFKSDINLKDYNGEVLYKYNTSVNKVYFDNVAKGFDCK